MAHIKLKQLFEDEIKAEVSEYILAGKLDDGNTTGTMGILSPFEITEILWTNLGKPRIEVAAALGLSEVDLRAIVGSMAKDVILSYREYMGKKESV